MSSTIQKLSALPAGVGFELRTNAQQHVDEWHQGEDLDFEAVMATAREE